MVDFNDHSYQYPDDIMNWKTCRKLNIKE